MKKINSIICLGLMIMAFSFAPKTLKAVQAAPGGLGACCYEEGSICIDLRWDIILRDGYYCGTCTQCNGPR